MRFTNILLCLSAIVSGCVSTSRYEELNKKYNDARAQLADRHVKVRSLEQALAEQEEEAARLQAEIDNSRAWIVALEGELDKSGRLVSDLHELGKEAVQQVGAVLTAMGRRRVQVEGHTDNVPIHNALFPSNWELASARALVVVRAMMTAGMPTDAVSAASYGEFHPAASNDGAIGRATNRRIEVVLLPDLSTLPGFDELQHAVSQQ